MDTIKAMTYIDISPSTSDGKYVFDAFFTIQHNRELTITESPVQTGANISDHAYMEPKELTMDVGMSEVMRKIDDYHFGITDGKTRSTTAYSTLTKLQEQRVPCNVVTRFGTYKNMLIETISVNDDNTTANGLKATITFKEILVAVVETVRISARAQKSTTTNNGDQKAKKADQSILSKILN